MCSISASVGDDLNILDEFSKFKLNRVNSLFYESQNQLVVSDECSVGVIDMETGNRVTSLDQAGFELSQTVNDPHRPFVVAVAVGSDICLFDNRAGSLVDSRIQLNELFSIRSFDINPNRESVYAVGTEDGRLALYDIRKPAAELSSTQAHSHYTNSVRYHPIHDELILTGGSDCAVNLHRFPHPKPKPLVESPRVGSASAQSKRQPVQPESVREGLVESFNCHDETVYQTVWGAGFVFASISHDGQVYINQVPQSEKIRILM